MEKIIKEMRGSILNKKTLLATLVFSLALAAGCGNAEPTSKNETKEEANTSVNLENIEKEIAKYAAPPEFIAPGEPFDAKAAMKGKTILSIPASSAIPFDKNIENAMKEVAKEVGFEFIEWENQGKQSEWAQGIQYGITKKVDVIDLLGGPDPDVLGPQIKAAQDAGIKVVTSVLTGFNQPAPPLVDANIPFQYSTAGKLLADWAILKTKGNANVLVITSNEVKAAKNEADGLIAELEKQCPSCTATVVNVPLVDWATKIQTNVQSQLASNPKINYILPVFDSMSQFITPALTVAGATDRVKIATFNGTPFVLDMLREGKVEMNLGQSLDWIGHAIMDAEMRLIAGKEVPKDVHIPIYIWDKNNIEQAGNPAQDNKGYGEDYRKEYAKLWGLTK
jgi:ribose transport system substrate-binding protein